MRNQPFQPESLCGNTIINTNFNATPSLPLLQACLALEASEERSQTGESHRATARGGKWADQVVGSHGQYPTNWTDGRVRRKPAKSKKPQPKRLIWHSLMPRTIFYLPRAVEVFFLCGIALCIKCRSDLLHGPKVMLSLPIEVAVFFAASIIAVVHCNLL